MKKKGKPEGLKGRLRLETRSDPEAYEKLLRVIGMALTIADMDEEQAKNYQSAFWKNL